MTASTRPVGHWPLPRWIAHRGSGTLAPENTLAAFERGQRHGYRAFECDVKLSADGVPFLLHDDTLDRTTSGRGLASHRSWQALAALDAGSWHSPAHAGEPLPPLATIAAHCRSHGLALNLEIKPSPGEDAATGHAVAMALERLWPGWSSPPLLLSSFSMPALAASRNAAPHRPRALLLDRLYPGWLADAKSLASSAVVVWHPLIDAAFMVELRAAGLHVLAYTVNDPADVERLLALGVDSLITDALDRFSPEA